MTEVSRPASQPTLQPGAARQSKQIIVAASDGESDAVFGAARLLAGRIGAEVVVLSVVEPLPPFTGDREELILPPGLVESQAATRHDSVERQVERTRAAAGDRSAPWPVEVRYGRPAQTIAAEAALGDADLVVMGIGRHKPIDRLLATETTLATVRRVTCPVFAVAGETRALPTVAVAATDFGPASLRAARAALPLLADGATLYLVHVWSHAGTSHPALADADAAYERNLPARFSRLQELLAAPPSIEVRPVELVGRPAEDILEFARGHGAELLVAGTHGGGFLDRLLVGSVATALLRGARCNVLVAPEPPLAQWERMQGELNPSAPEEWPEGWALRLEEFARRNHGRRTVLEVADRRLGAYVLESGYALLGATYEARDGRVELTLGDPADGAPRLTYGVGDVKRVEIVAGTTLHDRALSIHGENAHARLRFPVG